LATAERNRSEEEMIMSAIDEQYPVESYITMNVKDATADEVQEYIYGMQVTAASARHVADIVADSGQRMISVSALRELAFDIDKVVMEVRKQFDAARGEDNED